MNNAEIKTLIDDYLTLDVEIKSLERKRDKMKEQIISLGEGAHRANLGQATVTLSETRRLNNDLLKAKFGEDGLEDCYKTTAAITVRVALFPKEEV